MIISFLEENQHADWDDYVKNHPWGTLYHLFGWKSVIEKTYSHKAYYFIALRSSEKRPVRNQGEARDSKNSICGILPLVHLKHFLFNNSLISLPFFDFGGILADDRETEIELLNEALEFGRKLKVDNIELRHIQPLACINEFERKNSEKYNDLGFPIACMTKSHKVRMLLPLPETSEILMGSFKSKLRSQIRKPLKERLFSRIGGQELMESFYEVFSTHMRDLGSPVHSKKLLHNILLEFPDHSKFIVVYRDNKPLAGSLVIGFKDTLENPWASALKQYSRMSTNMLLYWTMLSYACDKGFKYFDFGRSTTGGETYKFKEQWGSEAIPLNWHYFIFNGHERKEEVVEKGKFERAIRYWQKLPVPVTKIIGPMIRKHIGL